MPRSMRSLIAACSAEMGGGTGPRRACSSSSTASIRRLSLRRVCPCLPPGDTGPPLALLHHGLKLVQAPLKLVGLAYPALDLERTKARIGYLVGDCGGRPFHPSFEHPGVEVFKEPLDLPYLGVVASTTRFRGV